MKHVIIINPIAGSKNQSGQVEEKAKQSFKGLDYEIYFTKAIGDATRYVKEYLNRIENKDEIVRFYACGGDGTLNEVANGIIGNSNAEFTCYPIGSGNDFLKYFGSAEDFLNFNNLINGSNRKVDILKFNDRYVCNIFNVGLDANVVHYQRKLKKWPLMSGKSAYNLGVAFSLLRKLNHKYIIKVDGEVIYNDKVTLCAICNAKCYGGGYYCAPLAKVDDGILDVCFVKKVSRLTFAKLVKIYKAGKHLEDPKAIPYIGYKQGKVVEIEIKKPLYYSIDGELGKTNKIKIEIIPGGMNFIIPKIDKN